jgi:thiol-disulfide isomerase/thioredoxin
VKRLALLLALCAVPAVLARAPAPPEKPAPAEVTLKTVKYADLGAFIRAQTGKVVVVDVWGTFCKPCMKEFPHLVELHNKHADDGLVCVSVAIDENEQEYRDKALAFLKKVNATFPNFMFEDLKVATDKLDLKSVPLVFVFNRAGRRAARFESDDEKSFNYEKDVTPLVEKLLAEK